MEEFKVFVLYAVKRNGSATKLCSVSVPQVLISIVGEAAINDIVQHQFQELIEGMGGGDVPYVNAMAHEPAQDVTDEMIEEFMRGRTNPSPFSNPSQFWNLNEQ